MKAVAWIVGIFLLVIFAALWGGGNEPDTETTGGHVRVVCSEAIRSRLVSPGSMKRVAQSETERIGSRWRWTVEIDSQNAFGALIRSKWGCSVNHETGVVTDVTQLQ